MNKPDAETTCPYTGHNKLCKELFMNCPKWIQIIGHDPNTGQEVNKYMCQDSWMPLLTIENSQQQRQTAAAVEDLRNVIHKGMQEFLKLAVMSKKAIKEEVI